MSIIVGTAGHIDHGKSSLIRALTGTDPDRLLEEQERGMTIDLGFAFLDDRIAFIDVPGHERFIKNMLAGASTIDVAMLVVAADDGVMPQTREHLDILSLLQVQQGLVVLTKTDLVDDDLFTLVRQDVSSLLAGTFLEQAPVFPVSTLTGRGIDELRRHLIALPDKNMVRPNHGVFWLPIDRSFTMKGFGTVVTGSVLSGQIRTGDVAELLPDGKEVKIRGLQSHGRPVSVVQVGQRAALNLQNISREEIDRGDVLATPGRFQPSKLLDARLGLLQSCPKELANRTRIRLHLGTREILARVKILDAEKITPGHAALVQFQLEEPAVTMRRDAFVIRRYSPPLTIGGGIILEANPEPHRRFDAGIIGRLRTLEKPDPGEKIIAACLARPYELLTVQEIEKATGLTSPELAVELEKLTARESIRQFLTGGKPAFAGSQSILDLKDRILETLKTFHAKEPLKSGMSKAELRSQISANLQAKLYDTILEEMIRAGSIILQPAGIRLSGHSIQLSGEDKNRADLIVAAVTRQLFSPPEEEAIAVETGLGRADVRRLLGALQGMNRVIRLEGDIFFAAEALSRAEDFLRAFAARKNEISVSEFREGLKTSRKYAMALLGYFDQKGITERVGDGRAIYIS